MYRHRTVEIHVIPGCFKSLDTAFGLWSWISQRHWEDWKVLVNAARTPSAVSATGMTQVFEKRLFYKGHCCWYTEITSKGTKAETYVLTIHTLHGNVKSLTAWRWTSVLPSASGLSAVIWDNFQSRAVKRTIPAALERFILAQSFIW